MRTEIIYEDNDILVIYKPAGLATQTARVGQVDVVSELKNYLSATSSKGASPAKGAPYIGVIHRLDQPVEGLLVFAKTKQAAASLTAQLQKKEYMAGLNKKYYAVVYLEGRRDAWEKPIVKTTNDEQQVQGVLENFLYKDKDNKAVVVDEAAVKKATETKDAVVQTAKKAKLEYGIVDTDNAAITSEKTDNEQIRLINIILHTGRFHQIRAQMAYAGMPLLGDQKYGTQASASVSDEKGVRNVALCAYQLEFEHPGTGEHKCFEIKPRGQIFGLFF